MKTYEYIRLTFDMGDLSDLNRLGSAGWRVVGLVPDHYTHVALLERELPSRAETVKEFAAGIPFVDGNI